MIEATSGKARRDWTLRRRWRNCCGAVFFAFALAVQMSTPIVAGRDESGRWAEQFLSICSRVAADAVGDGQHSPGPRGRHCDACPICQGAGGKIGPVEATSALRGPAQTRWIVLAWTPTAPPLSGACREYAHQARAPPINS